MSQMFKIGPHLLADSVKTVTISSGASLSGTVDVQGFNTFAIEMSTGGWDAANISFTAARASSGSFFAVYDGSGVEVQATVSTGNRVVSLNGDIALALAPLRFIQLRSGTSTAAVNQTATRTLYLICK
jgi:hypothetical protein